VILELLNEKKIKVRLKPRSMAHMMEAANGTPTRRKSTDFSYKNWSKEVLGKLNTALQNVKIVDDLGGSRPGKGEIPLSLIPPGEYYKLYERAFPGYSTDPSDLRDKDHAPGGTNRKGIRSRESDPPGQ